MSEYGIKDKIFSIATDNANNMTAAIELFEKNREIKIIHVRCAAHIIHLIVQVGLESQELRESFEKIRYFCKKIHSSSKLTEYLSTQISIFKEKQISVVLDIDTRWNSTHDMLNRALELKNSITAVSSYLFRTNETEYSIINEEDWKKAETICEFLEPFNQGNIK